MQKITSKAMLLLLLFKLSTMNAQQYINGSLATGTVTKNGTIALPGRTWAELQNDEENNTVTNISLGIPINNPNLPSRYADDFTIPNGEIWHLNSMDMFATIHNLETMPLPFNFLSIEIWNGDPSLTGTQKIYGDIDTNVLDPENSGDSFMDHIKNTAFSVPPYEVRHIWKLRGNINVTLPGGTYWLYFKSTSAVNNASQYIPFCIVGGKRGLPHYNSKYHRVTPFSIWTNCIDTGGQSQGVSQDYPFILNYTSVLGIGGHDGNDNIIAYPNPTEANLMFNLTNAEKYTGSKTIFVTDMRGVMVFQANIENHEINTVSIDLSSLHGGLYIVRIMEETKVIYQGKITKL
jgi:hypothetical protein